MPVHLFGFLAMVVQFLLVGVGMPLQIRALYRAKTSTEHSAYYHVLSVAGCVLWLLNSQIEVPNPHLSLPQIPAIIMGGVIIAQVVYYRFRSTASLAPVS